MAFLIAGIHKMNNKQLTWDYKFLEIAELLSEMSHCQKIKVCALAVKNNRIIATGLNGTVKGMPNCCDVFDKSNLEHHHDWSQHNEIHAEQNLITEVAKCKGSSLEGCSIYINLQPCSTCALLLTNIGVKRIIFSKRYHKSDTEHSENMFKYLDIEYKHLNLGDK